jgi:hypothetical protein
LEKTFVPEDELGGPVAGSQAGNGEEPDEPGRTEYGPELAARSGRLKGPGADFINPSRVAIYRNNKITKILYLGR